MSDNTKPVVTMMLNAMSPETQAKLLAEQELGLGGFLKHVAKDVLHVAEKVVGGTAKATEKVVEDVGIKAPVAVIKATNKAINKTTENQNRAQAARSKAKTASEFEKLHPRGPDGRFTDEPGGGTGGLLPKPENVLPNAQNTANYDQYKKKFVDWSKKQAAFDKAQMDKKRTQANDTYDSADNHLQLAEKYKAQLEDARKVGAIGQYKKLQANIDKNQKKAEELRRKADAEWNKPVKPYPVKTPVAPKGVQEAPPPPPPGTGVGLLPKSPVVKLPPKTKTGTPTKVHRLTSGEHHPPASKTF